METYPRWTAANGGGWCIRTAAHREEAGFVGYRGDIYGSIRTYWETPGGDRAFSDDLPSAADAAEASLRKAGVLPPDASVWRPVELRGPVWLTEVGGLVRMWRDEHTARVHVATRPGVRLFRAVEVES